jgi:hypothetical protein
MPTAANRQSRDIRRQTTRERAREQARIARDLAAVRQETLDELISPASQRLPVLGPSGDVVRAPRAVRDGISFTRANPLTFLEARAERGGSMFRPEHFTAAKRLTTTWEAVGAGVGPASIDLGSPRVTRSSAPTAPPQHAALLRQVEMQRELQAVYSRLQGTGIVWECLKAIVLEGLSPASWAAEINTHPKEVAGILLGSLSYLARIYELLDPATEPARRGRLRTWVTGERSGMEDAAD